MLLKLRDIFSKFIFGDLGLATTFWVFGILLAFLLDYTFAHWVSVPWRWLLMASLMITHACLITVAVWNAANKYNGQKIWAVTAKIIAIFGAARWVLVLPDFVVAFLSVIGLNIYSHDFWELNYRDLTCGPALLQFTPEKMTKKYKRCISEPFDEGKGIYLNCGSSELKTAYIYTTTLDDCNKWANKFKAHRNKH